MIKIMTWNIGSFVFLKYKAWGGRDHYEYFQPSRNGDVVSKGIKSMDPDIVFLQEFWSEKDAESIKSLEMYPFRQFVDMWYRKSGMLIASKKPFTLSSVQGYSVVSYIDYTIIPIHLYSFDSSKRYKESCVLNELLPETNLKKIILGDTNIWSRNGFYLFSNDYCSYKQLTTSLVDVSKDITSTNYYGFGLDKIFASKDLVHQVLNSPRLRGRYMDHYPVYVEFK